MKRQELKEIIEALLPEATNKVRLKPDELGEGVPVSVHIDDEGYLIFKEPRTGQHIFLHPSQIPQLNKFLMKNKTGLSKVLKPKAR